MDNTIITEYLTRTFIYFIILNAAASIEHGIHPGLKSTKPWFIILRNRLCAAAVPFLRTMIVFFAVVLIFIPKSMIEEILDKEGSTDEL